MTYRANELTRFHSSTILSSTVDIETYSMELIVQAVLKQIGDGINSQLHLLTLFVKAYRFVQYSLLLTNSIPMSDQ